MGADMQLPRVSPEEEFFFRASFCKVLASGVDTEVFNKIYKAAGMGVSQSSGNLLLTTGTGTNEETIIRSIRPFAGTMTLRDKVALSQRIANQSFYVELVDVIGDNLALTINSATSVTVRVPEHKFTSANVGQSMNIGALTGTAGMIPGRYAIASISGDDITFTVASFPASGSGTCSLFGLNYHRWTYDGATATNAKFDSQRMGWNSGDTTVSINTTASPGHVAITNIEDGVVSTLDQLVASSSALQATVRGSRVENIPANDVNMFLQIRMVNGTVAPASTTTLTVGLVSVEQYNTTQVSLSSVRPQSFNHSLPVIVTSNISSNNLVGGVAAHDAVIAGNPVRIGGRALTSNYTAVSTGDTADFVTTLVGAQIMKPFSIPEADWTYAAANSGILNTTTAVTIKAAAAAGIRNYLTSIDIFHEALTNATEVRIRDGAGGSTIWQTKLPSGAAGRFTVNFPTPLKGTAATLMEIVTITASGAGAVYVNAQGFIAP